MKLHFSTASERIPTAQINETCVNPELMRINGLILAYTRTRIHQRSLIQLLIGVTS